MKCGQPQPGLTHAPGRRIRRWHPLSSSKLQPGALYLCQPSLSRFNLREKRLPGFLGPSPFSNHPFLPVNPWEAYLAGPAGHRPSLPGSAREGALGPASLLLPKFVPIHPASPTGFIPPGPGEMGLGRLAGRGLAGWVQGGAGRGGFCKGDMAEWTQELETFAGASVSSGERRGRQLGPNSAGLGRSEEWAMEASGPEGEGLWVPPGSVTPEVRDTPPL